VLFGGTDAQGGLLADTWEWDGTSWNERIPTSSPAARTDHAMAYDPRRQRVVVFGGRALGGRQDDAWEWDGDAGTWLELAPATQPSKRSGMDLAPDVTGSLIAVGGVTVLGAARSDVLRLSSTLSTAPRESCRVASADQDGDGLAGCADPDCWTRCAPLCAPGTSCVGPSCGDGACSELEDYLLCPSDCAPP
jgi:hypothetical protein